MSLRENFRECIALSKPLLFPYFWMKYVLWLMVLALALGGMLYWWIDVTFFMVVAAILYGSVIMVAAIYMPGQVLSIVTSRQFRLLPKIRTTAIFILFLGCVAGAVPVSFLISQKQESVSFINIFNAVLIVGSLVLSGVLFLCSRFPRAQGLFLLLLIFSTDVIFFLVRLPVAVGAAAIVINWVVFSFWFIRWLPTQYMRNLLVISDVNMFDAQKKYAAGFQSINRVVKVIPETWIGSVLLWRADGLWGNLRAALVSIIFIPLAFVPMVFISRDMPERFFVKMILLFLPAFVFSAATGLTISVVNNIHRAWIYFHGSRLEFFNFLERTFYPNYLVALVPFVLLYILASYFGVYISGFLTFAILTAIGILHGALFLYVGILMYGNSKFKMSLMGFVIGAFVLALCGQSFYLGMFTDQQLSLGVETVPIVVTLLLIVLFVRYQAMKSWSHISFVRTI